MSIQKKDSMAIDDIQVTIICLAYNHGKYIRNALEAFINQKTTFKYEVIVHDDASTDNTAEVIGEYVKKYPDIIVPIYQKVNQYSQGIQIITDCVYPIARGKYIAMCEADDYWCNDNKLQMQYDIMEKHPECSICCHYTKCVDITSGEMIQYMPDKKYGIGTGIVEKEKQLQVILEGLFHINSSFFRRDIYDEYVSDKPEYARLSPVGDLALEMFFYLHGEMYFIDEVFSVYNKGTTGSFTERIERNTKVVSEYQRKRGNAFYCFGKFVKKADKKIVDETAGLYLLQAEVNEGNYKYAIKPENRHLLKEFGIRTRLKMYIGAFWPEILNLYMKNRKQRKL